MKRLWRWLSMALAAGSAVFFVALAILWITYPPSRNGREWMRVRGHEFFVIGHEKETCYCFWRYELAKPLPITGYKGFADTGDGTAVFPAEFSWSWHGARIESFGYLIPTTSPTTNYRILQATFPIWMPLVLAAAYPIWWTCFYLHRRRTRRNPDPAAVPCPNCGYDLRATKDRCPECGAAKMDSGYKSAGGAA